MKTLIIEALHTRVTLAFASPGRVYASKSYDCDVMSDARECVRAFLSETKKPLRIKIPCIVVAHSGRSAVRFAKLPRLKKSEIREASGELFAKYFPKLIQIGGYVFGAQKIFEDTHTHFALAAIPEEIPRMWISACDDCGLALIALRNYEVCLGVHNASQQEDHTIIIAGPAGGAINVLFLRNGAFEESRRISADKIVGARELKLCLAFSKPEKAILYNGLERGWLPKALRELGIKPEPAQDALDYLHTVW